MCFRLFPVQQLVATSRAGADPRGGDASVVWGSLSLLRHLTFALRHDGC